MSKISPSVIDRGAPIVRKMRLPICLTLLLGLVSSTNAGIVFTNEAAFNVAVAGLTQAGLENFDALPVGPVGNPATFMGGLIEIGDTNPLINNGGFRSFPHEWVGNVSTSGNPVTVTGPGASALGFNAFALPNRRQFGGTWTFTTSTGTDLFGQSQNFGYSFLGWVGTGTETLSGFSYNSGGIAFDDLAAYSAQNEVPEPSTIAIWSILGCVGLAIGYRRRRMAA